jgi:hypothetical protein
LGGNKQNWDGFLKIAVPVFRLPNGTAKSAKHAKFSDLLGDLPGTERDGAWAPSGGVACFAVQTSCLI